MRYLLFLIVLFSLPIDAQEIEWKGAVSLGVLASSENYNPFWTYRNTNTRWGETSNYSASLRGEATYNFSENHSLSAGFEGFLRDNVADEFQRRDLYVTYQYEWLQATVGAKHAEAQANGLSVTNKNFLVSGNARPLPGILLETSRPITIAGGLSFQAGLGHYQLNDDRYVNDTRVHFKEFILSYQFNEDHKLTGRLQHYAQWAGTSPVFSELESDFGAFVDVFFASKAEEINVQGEIQNAVGNHLGTYLLDYEFTTQVGEFSLYHEHPFEDGSGTRLANFPDGVWGVFYQPTEGKWLSGVLYEYVDTSDQGVNNQLAGPDNYFSNTVYKSGWSYDGSIIGMPFILFDPDLPLTPTNSPVISNRAKVHHFGLNGTIKKVDWMVKSSFVTHLGKYQAPFTPAIKLWHNYASVSYPTQKFGTIALFGALDSGETIDTNVGGGLTYSYSF